LNFGGRLTGFLRIVRYFLSSNLRRPRRGSDQQQR
jgi:hypothetical protein